ncbi:MAG: hypothetical protein PF517_16435 [Salinivirgaceae bacterium]|jgi:hypothetical protein|nr:hypothetical protein [Salinivirgaceae bacterium]
MKHFIFIIPFLACLSFGYSQNSPTVEWRQISTPHFKVVYPCELDVQANYASHLLEKSYILTSKIYNHNPKPIKLFLFNQSATSNGYVALGPRRMAWYTTPSQKTTMIGNTDWFQALAIHEYRHVVQFSKLDTNLTSFASMLLGDIGRTICYTISMPRWYFEGDAVYAETQLSNNGRGRMPSFYRDINSLETTDIRYSYQKAYLGSYKNYFPNWYHLGYLMSKHVISNYGEEAWRKSVEHATKISIYPFAFSRGLKKNTGYNIKNTYSNTLNEFKSQQEQIKKNSINSILNIKNSEEKNVFTNYTYPESIGTDSIIAFKKGFNNSGELVLLINKSENELIKINPTDRIHSNGSNAVWSTTIPDIRWPEQSYSDIVLFNIKTKLRKRITHKQKLYAPALSPEGSKIAAIEYNSKMECSLVIIDASSGNELLKFKVPLGVTLRTPSWNINGSKIVVTSSFAQNNSLVVYNSKSGNYKTIKTFGSENVSNPIFYQNYLLYNSPYNATDALYALDTSNNDMYIVATSEFGLYNPSIDYDSNQLLMQNYQPNGFNVASMSINTESWKKIESSYIENRISANLLWDDDKSENIFANFNIDTLAELLPSKKYSPILNAIKVHSWAPYPTNRGIGFNVFADDELYTTHARAGIEYYPNDQANRVFTELSYTGIYPELTLNYSNGRKYVTDTTSDNSLQKIDENVFGFQIGLPLNLSMFNYDASLSLNAGFDQIYQREFYDSINFTTTDLSLINAGFEYINLRQSAYRDVMPKFGLELSSVFYNSIKANSDFKNRSTSKVSIYLPAPFNHGLKLIGGVETNNAQANSTFIYQLDSDLDMVYGYSKPNFTPELYMHGAILYGLPLFYPDMALGPILYCKRIRANLFYSYGTLSFNNYNLNLSSYGAEFHGEFNFFNLAFPIEFGARISYLEKDNKIAFEFMLMGVPF